MATYYVSSTTGNDSNNGTAVATPKATIGAGEDLAQTPININNIAPGNYRENVVHGYSGTAADRIYFIGDPDCEIFGNLVTPGVVRITHASDTNELAYDGTGSTNGPVVRTNGKDYITWKNVHVDGTVSGVNAYNDRNTGNAVVDESGGILKCTTDTGDNDNVVIVSGKFDASKGPITFTE